MGQRPIIISDITEKIEGEMRREREICPKCRKKGKKVTMIIGGGFKKEHGHGGTYYVCPECGSRTF